MADAQVLRDLALTVEGLNGGSVAVDADIRGALRSYGPLVGLSVCPTHRLDDAAALMPEGWFIRVEKNSHNWWHCFARPRAYSEPWAHGSTAATEALARTACALVVIAADLEGKTDGL